MTYWLLYYEDASIPVGIFTDEATARATYEQVSERFNCTLFVDAASSVWAGAGQVPADTIEKARDAIQQLCYLLGFRTTIVENQVTRRAVIRRGHEALAALAAVRTPEEQT